MRENKVRNEQLVGFKKKNPEFSFSELGVVFGIKKQVAHRIYQRDKDRYATHASPSQKLGVSSGEVVADSFFTKLRANFTRFLFSPLSNRG